MLSRSGMAVPAPLLSVLDDAPLDARALHAMKLALARLVLGQASPNAVNQLDLAQRFLEGNATLAELHDARQDAWTYIGSLACYCSVTDSASAQAVLACLEADASAHTLQSLSEQVERVLRCRVPESEVERVLSRTSEPRAASRTP
ncbi:MAG: hypothetical protein QM756_34045 [Polyangiaceae bacterium]